MPRLLISYLVNTVVYIHCFLFIEVCKMYSRWVEIFNNLCCRFFFYAVVVSLWMFAYICTNVYTHKNISEQAYPPPIHTHTCCSILYHSLKTFSRLLHKINKNKEKTKSAVQEMRTSFVTSNAQQTMKISCFEEMAEHHLHHFDTSSVISIFLHFLLYAENVSYW